MDTSGNIAALKRRGFRVVATYDYHDERGQLLYQNVRLEHFAADGKRDAKTFRQRRPKEGVPGAFAGYLGDVRRVPFRLPAIAEAKHQAIDIAEGEKDAERLASLGLLATSVATPSTTDLSAFTGHAIYIHANNDAPGRKKAKKLAKLLEPIAADVFIVSYPDTGPGGDVSDWLDQGNGLDALLVRRGEAPPFFATHAAGDVGEFRAARADEIYWPDWEKGGPRSKSAANIRAFLAHAGVMLRRNLFAYRDEITRGGKTEPLSDAIVVALRLEAHAQHLDPPEAFFNDVVNDVARADGYHPVSEYLGSKTWDGKPRLDTWLAVYAGAPDTPLNRAFGRKILVAAVRRVRRPGCKFDSCLVLEGPQGAGKSSLVRTLASPEWFTDCVSIGAVPKLVIEQTAGAWLVEMAELAGLQRREIEHVKTMISRQTDRARLSYDRRTTDVPRQFVLFGTVNDSAYLRDTTGNRRFWPVKVGKISLTALAADRDQLWAEAAQIEASGEALELPRELFEAAAAEQDARLQVDPWQEKLEPLLDGKRGARRGR